MALKGGERAWNNFLHDCFCPYYFGIYAEGKERKIKEEVDAERVE